jgi:quercetin dioxygenase-like cupin family protein
MFSAGVTKAGTGIDGIVWNILGQTYVPKHLSDSSFAWHATFPPGTFVPPHIHPTQDEFIYMLEGRFDLLLDGREQVATGGDFIRLPMNVAHGIFNKSDQVVKCLFWFHPHASFTICFGPCTAYRSRPLKQSPRWPRNMKWRSCRRLSD